MNTPHNRTRRGAAILFSGILVLGGLAVAGDASAVKDGDNPSCADLGYDFGQKWEDPSGTYDVDRDGMDANFTVGTYTSPDPLDPNANPNANNAIIGYSISTNADGYAVVVKGGDGANVYRQGELTNPMHAPALGNGKWPTISHFQLCWNKPAPEPEVGQLEVTKVVTGEGAPADVEFEIGVTPSGGGETLYQKVKGGETVTFGDLPVGDYVVTETDPGPLWAVKGSGVTVTVELEDTAVATVTNTWIPPDEEFGRVEVTKVVTGEGAPVDDEYEICLTGPDPSTTKVCETVVGEGTATFTNLVPGTYKVTETDPGTEYQVTITPATVEVAIGEAATATATVTNTWIPPSEEFGRVEVTKVVTGVGAPTNDVFELCLTGPDPSTTKVCKTVVGEGTVTFGNLVPGTYKVTETDPGTEYQVTITPATVEVTIGGAATATVTNEYTQQESLPPTVPVTPEVLPPTVPTVPTVPAAPVTPVTPAAPATPSNVAAAEAALPSTGSEGGIAVIATILVAAGIVLTLVGRRREPQQA